eukprot:TRINITY_DN154852_c0_g1_i1.p1 TRINITY_DN154852_c0_g1~~TRINITY_DN154852_c0_g1_i1.p1  ORF type:complete len:182 (+),score=27.88 TRINITY_DN154852_c0_g1_i1:112-657(+)
MSTSCPPFVGWVRLHVVDCDGLEKRVKGMNLEAPVHKSEKDGKIVFTADMPREDPIRLLHLTGDESDLLMVRWVAGHSELRSSSNRLLAALNTLRVKTACEEASSSVNEGPLFKGTACVPFVSGAYDRQVDVRFHTKEHKLVTRIIKVELEVPIDVFQEWEAYHESLKEWEKEMTAMKREH